MKFKKISIGACILALVLIAGATTAFAATATNDNGSHISRSDAVLIDVDGNFQKVDVTGEVDSSDVHFISDYNGLTLVEVQNDNSKNILDDTGDSFISLAKDAPVTLGVGSWKQGDTFVLECKNEGSNAIKIKHYSVCAYSKHYTNDIVNYFTYIHNWSNQYHQYTTYKGQ